MVIQRLQSLYLLLAIIAMTLVFYLPFGLIIDATDPATTVELVTLDYPILLVLNSLITLLLLIDIFLFKNLSFQRLVAAVCILLIIASAATTFIILSNIGDMWKIAWAGAPVALLFALFLTIAARYRMGKDLKLLRSYDRLR
ncbi:MAG: DUF4293 domain-containing protein [Clostridiales bacterium]|nr:DUF4293 domain-containing protein [Clostridiales bacterium]